MIVLYDGDCGFCRWSVDWALRRDRDAALEAVPIQSPRGAELLADLTEDERLRAVHVVGDDGARESGGAAAIRVFEALPHTGVVVRLGRISPRATEAVYAFVARHRGFFGRFLR